ncbi:MAG: cell division protein FtsZ [Myxococcales bacterium]|nr:cell division protein FtsZ [Myxococcales bacterium]|tara:strand:- start:216 stop:1640 length:1425 start_codon:yes stop_codon:yes gene_type:complete
MLEWIGPEQEGPVGARIKIVGVGGGGGNAVNNMIDAALSHVSYMVANTDQQALARSLAVERIQLGADITRGLGAGANPDIGHRAAMEDEASIRAALEGNDMVFVTAGMGGGTGTGAAPVIAQIAREVGALTVAVVTRPFGFEGKSRSRRADRGLLELADAVDTLIVIPNDRLLELADDSTTLTDGFKMADTVLLDAVRGISDIILTPGLVNVDFADVSTIMKGKGMALMGTGCASGPERARLAAQQAISSPLLEDVRIEGATGLLVNITGGNTSLREVNAALSLIQDAVHDDTDTIFGAVVDSTMGEDLRITVVATGFDRDAKRQADTGPYPAVDWDPSSNSGRGYTGPTAPVAAEPIPVQVPVMVRAEATSELAASLSGGGVPAVPQMPLEFQPATPSTMVAHTERSIHSGLSSQGSHTVHGRPTQQLPVQTQVQTASNHGAWSQPVRNPAKPAGLSGTINLSNPFKTDPDHW